MKSAPELRDRTASPSLSAHAGPMGLGWRHQNCRELVIEAMKNSSGEALSAKELCSRIGGREVPTHMTMLYRVLKRMEADGLLRRFWEERNGRAHSVYRLAAQAVISGSRLICRLCGRSISLDASALVAQLVAKSEACGLPIEKVGITIEAVCRACASMERDSRARPRLVTTALEE